MNKTPEITLDSKIKRGDDLLAQSLDEDIVMASIESGKYYGLELTGKRIWELLEQPRTVADLCARLLAQFDVERTTCERETLAFLKELHRERLIQVVD